jgi:hypothetical protein
MSKRFDDILKDLKSEFAHTEPPEVPADFSDSVMRGVRAQIANATDDRLAVWMWGAGVSSVIGLASLAFLVLDITSFGDAVTQLGALGSALM